MTKKLTLAIPIALIASAAVFAQAPEPVSPGAPGAVSRVNDSCPTFSWGSQPGVERHELLVYRIPETTAVEPGAIDTAFSPEAELISQIDLPGSASSWTPPADLCLTAGDTYAWTIRSHAEESATDWAEARLFSVDERDVEMSELEAAIEKVLDRYLEQQRIDAATAAALRANPTALVQAAEAEPAVPSPLAALMSPTFTGVQATLSDELPRQVAIHGVSNGDDFSAGVQGEATKVNALTFGVAGSSAGELGGSSGVLGEAVSTETGFGPKYGVRGISQNFLAASAGVRGDGKLGILGVGDTGESGLGIIGVAFDIDLANPNNNDDVPCPGSGDAGKLNVGLPCLAAGLPPRTGVFGLTTESTGFGGVFRNTANNGIGLWADGDTADIKLQTGVVQVPNGESISFVQTDGSLAPLVADGSGLADLDAATLDGKDSDDFLLSNPVGIEQFTGGELEILGKLDIQSLLELPIGGLQISGAGHGSGLNADKIDNIEGANVMQTPAVANLNMTNPGSNTAFNIQNANSLTVTGTTDSTTVDTGSIVTDGGIGVQGAVTVGTSVKLGTALILQNNETITNAFNSVFRLGGDTTNFLDINILDGSTTPSGISLNVDNSSGGVRPGIGLTLRAEASPSPTGGVGNPGGSILLEGGSGGQDSPGGDITLQAGSGINGNSSGGNIVLKPGLPGTSGAEGAVQITGTRLVLDSDVGTTVDSDILIVASQTGGGANDGALRYNGNANRWEFSNNGGAFEQIPLFADIVTNPVGSNIELQFENGEEIGNPADHLFRIQDGDVPPGSVNPPPPVTPTFNAKSLDVDFANPSTPFPERSVTVTPTDLSPSGPFPGLALILRGGKANDPGGVGASGGDLLLVPGAKQVPAGTDGVVRVTSPAGAESLVVSASDSAVSHVTLAPGVGAPPRIASASGTLANVDLDLAALGTAGRVSFQSSALIGDGPGAEPLRFTLEGTTPTCGGGDYFIWAQGSELRKCVAGASSPLDTTVGSTLSVKEQDADPTIGSVGTLTFDQADGFVVSSPASGEAKVEVSHPWEQLTNLADTPTTFTADNDLQTVSFAFNSDFSADRFSIAQASGNPSGGALLDLRAADSDVVLFRAGGDTNNIRISEAGALAASGSGSITATALATDTLANVAEIAASLCSGNGKILEKSSGDWACIDTPAALTADSVGTDELDDSTTPEVGDLISVATGGKIAYVTPNIGTSVAADLEEEGQIAATTVTGNASGDGSTDGPDSLLLGTDTDTALWASLPKCASANSHLTYDGNGGFACDADDAGSAATYWETLTKNDNTATTFLADTNDETVTFNFDSDFTADRFVIKQTGGDPSGTDATLLDLSAVDTDVELFSAGTGSNTVQISQAGALTASGSASITATAVAADSVALETGTTGTFVNGATNNKGLAITSTATDAETLGLINCTADGQVLKYETTGGTWGCAADNDTSPTDIWVDEAGDTMTGNLLVDPTTGTSFAITGSNEDPDGTSISVTAGDSTSGTTGNGGGVTVTAGSAPNGTGGNITLTPGTGGTAGGSVVVSSAELRLDGNASNIVMNGLGPKLIYEGTADSFETELAFGDPTADVTVTVPAVTGTVVVANDESATADDATPSVAGISVLVFTGYTAATDVTNLEDGVGGQCVVLVGGGSNTANPVVKDAGSLKLAADWTAADDATLTLCRAGSNWFETARAAA